jgi:LCP family protein required for cell wall assembly
VIRLQIKPIRHKGRLIARILLLAAALAVAALLAAGVSCYLSLAHIAGNAGGEAVGATGDTSDVVNILVTGTDISGKRTDSIMVAGYNKQKGTLTIVSVPRDTLVTINGRRAKINAAGVYGGESLLISKVQQLLGVSISYYVSIDYTGFDKVVDAIGGVDMTIPYNMDYDDPVQNLHIHFTKGAAMHLNGVQAEEFYRWRKNNDGTGLATGDIGRIGNQHLLIRQILAQFKSPLAVFRAPAALSAASDYVKTNMTPAEMVHYGLSFARTGDSKTTQATLQGSTPMLGGVSYFVYEPAENTALVSALGGGSGGSAGEASTGASLRVEVLNCSRRTGLAAQYAARLEKEGYAVAAVGNGAASEYSSVTVYGQDSAAVARIRSAFGVDRVVSVKSKTGAYDVVVRLGRKFSFSD